MLIKSLHVQEIDFSFFFSDNCDGGEKRRVCILFKWEFIKFRKSVEKDIFCKDHFKEGMLKKEEK